MSINLNRWRIIPINNKGEWKPGKIEPYPSKYDGGYAKKEEKYRK